MSSCCHELHNRLTSVRNAAVKICNTLCWKENLSRGHSISHRGFTLLRCDGGFTSVGQYLRYAAWAAGGELPPMEYFAWRVRIQNSFRNQGRLLIGICDASSRHGWGVCPFDGKLYRRCRSSSGQLIKEPPPEGYPDGDNTLVFRDLKTSKPHNLDGRANGAIIECMFDKGTFYVRVGEGPPVPALVGFPVGCVLRPWASLLSIEDCVNIGPICCEGGSWGEVSVSSQGSSHRTPAHVLVLSCADEAAQSLLAARTRRSAWLLTPLPAIFVP